MELHNSYTQHRCKCAKIVMHSSGLSWPVRSDGRCELTLSETQHGLGTLQTFLRIIFYAHHMHIITLCVAQQHYEMGQFLKNEMHVTLVYKYIFFEKQCRKDTTA